MVKINKLTLAMIILIILLALSGCNLNSKYKVTELKFGTNKELLEIANSNQEVKGYLQNREYSYEISKVSQQNKEELPSVYKDLEGELYKIYYRTEEFDLLVVMNKNEVLKVLPISTLTI